MIAAALCLASTPLAAPVAFAPMRTARRTICPEQVSERTEAIDKAIKWLVESANEEAMGDLSMPNSEGKWLVAAAAALFATEIHGRPASVEPEAFEAAVNEWESTLATALAGRGVTGGAFSSWIDGCRVPLLVERSLRSGKPSPGLPEIAESFADRQNTEGGWTHGAAGQMVSFYPSTLIAATNLALVSLGSTRRLSGEADEDSIEGGLTLLERVQAPSGGFAYGGMSYRVGVEAGRTCGAILALAALDQRESALFRNAVAYVRKNMDRVPHGHASPAMHVMLGSLATAVMGASDAARYDELVLSQVVEGQNEDGWFADLVEDSPDTMELLGGELLGRTYVTALHLAALTAPRSEFARWLSGDVEVWSPTEALTQSTTVKPVRRDAVAGARAHSVEDGVLHVLDSTGIVHRLGAFDGTSARLGPFPLPDGEISSFQLRGDSVLIALTQAHGDSASAVLSRSRAGAASPDWTTAFEGPQVRGLWRSESVWMMGMDGRSIEVNATTGAVEREVPSGSNPIRAALWADTTGVIRGTGPSIVADFVDRKGWSRRLRGPRGASAPVHTSIACVDELVYAGASDGVVLARRLEDGEFVGEVECGTSVIDLSVLERTLIAATDAGQLVAIQDGKELWRVDARGGREGHSTRSLSSASGVLFTSWAGHLFEIELQSGKILWSHITKPDEVWSHSNEGWIRLQPTDEALHLEAFRFGS